MKERLAVIRDLVRRDLYHDTTAITDLLDHIDAQAERIRALTDCLDRLLTHYALKDRREARELIASVRYGAFEEARGRINAPRR